MREFRANRKALGLCYRCDNPVRPGGLLCQTHRKIVTKRERPLGSKSKKCEFCKKDSGQTYYCEEHREAGHIRELEARTIKSRVSGRCHFCGILGHERSSCRARLGLCPVVEDAEYVPLDKPFLSISDAKEGDTFVWVVEGQHFQMTNPTNEESVLTVRYGGRVLIKADQTVTPMGAEDVFKYTTSPIGWQCVNRDAVPVTGIHSDTTISDVFFTASVRTTNVLYDLGLDTMGDLYSLGRNKLMETRKFGRRSMEEVEQTLAKYRLPPLSDDGGELSSLQSSGHHRAKARAGVEIAV